MFIASSPERQRLLPNDAAPLWRELGPGRTRRGLRNHRRSGAHVLPETIAHGIDRTPSASNPQFLHDDPEGKLVHGPNPPFNRIVNGLPGIEARTPMPCSGAVATGCIDIHRLVAFTSTNAAKLYGLYPRKGTIAIGSDADLAIRDPIASSP